MEDKCLFCKIIKGEISSHQIYEDDNFLSFLDIFPVNPGHALVVPKSHQQFISDLDDPIIGQLMVVGKKVSIALRKAYPDCLDINLYLCDGPAAGQTIPHVHLHIIPRFKNDQVGLKHGDKKQAEDFVLSLDAENIKKYI